MSTVMSIQSSVAFGHVGNSAAVFPLQRLGVEVLPVNTVCFSNHTGYISCRGPSLRATDVADVLRGVEERGAFADVDAVLTGYLGATTIVDVVRDAVIRVKAANPRALFVCDPVMGNERSGCYVSAELRARLREHLVPLADVITPNQFELGLLTDSRPRDLDSTLEAVAAIQARGPATVLVTSVLSPEGPRNTVGMVAACGQRAWLVRTDLLPIAVNGSGDITAALFTAHLLDTADPALALSRTASSVWDVVKVTLDLGRRELALVPAQEHLARPRMQFEVTTLR